MFAPLNKNILFTWIGRRRQVLFRTLSSTTNSNSRASVIEQVKKPHPNNNVPPAIVDKLDRQLHLQRNHPLNIIKTRIEEYCDTYAKQHQQSQFNKYDDVCPLVDTVSCFDDLRVGPDHVSRRPSDTYYVTDQLLLRTHTSAHQTRFIANILHPQQTVAAAAATGSGTAANTALPPSPPLPPPAPIAFLCSGDVYRRDEIDASHYPVFHQMEGVRIFAPQDYANALYRELMAVRSRSNGSGNSDEWSDATVAAVAADMAMDAHTMRQIAYLLPCTNTNTATTTAAAAAAAAEITNMLPVSAKKLLIQRDLKAILFGLCGALFGASEAAGTVRWRADYFPFTEPSFEVDVLFDKGDGGRDSSGSGSSNPSAEAVGGGDDDDDDDDGKWLEVLGCGVVHDDVMQLCAQRRLVALRAMRDSTTSAAAAEEPQHGWAFGLGLERLAMILFGIPDIRLFWSRDERFLTQFAGGGVISAAKSGTGREEPIQFQPFSKYPLCYKDVSFWIPSSASTSSSPSSSSFHSNDVFDVIRSTAGDLVEKVRQIDAFTHPKTGRISHAYRINYRSMERSLTNEEVDAIQKEVRSRLEEQLGVTLR